MFESVGAFSLERKDWSQILQEEGTQAEYSEAVTQAEGVSKVHSEGE